MSRLIRKMLFAGGILCSVALGDTLTVTANKDATLIEHPTGDRNNGGEDNFHVGRTNGAASEDIRRGILQFNLSSIPVGSVVTAVTVTLNMTGANAPNQTISFHKCLADWGEGTSTGGTGGGQGGPPTSGAVTWLHRNWNSTLWSAAGGQFTAAASASTSVGASGFFNWSSATLTADVQGWVNNPSTNFGWIIRGNETTAGSTKRFSSKQEPNSALRPKIVVTFTPPTGACCLPNGTCTIITQASCGSQGGLYQGNSTVCSPDPCPTPTGRCCVGNTCSITTQAACSGTYGGHGTNCTPNPCGGNTTTTFNAAADTTIYSHLTSNSNGAGETIVVGSSFSLIAPTTRHRAGLIRFDLSSVPTNAVVSAATLEMTLVLVNDSDGDVITIHRVTRGWGEAGSNASGTEIDGAAAALGDATWLHTSYSRGLWTNPGGDYVALSSASAIVGTTTGVESAWTSSRVVQDVQGWINNPSTNHGWEIIGESSPFATSLRGFASRTNPTPRSRPTLRITYLVPEPTGRCCLPSGACLVSTSASCSGMGGTYAGNGTNCTINVCPQPTGSCCLPSGTCVVVTAANCNSQSGVYNGDNSLCADQNCPIVLTPFIDALPIPPIARPVTGTAGGAAHYNIAMVEFTHQLHSELPVSRVWGYAGSYPGPTIEAFRDQPVTVTWINDLRNSAPGTGFGQLRTTHMLPVDTCLHGPDMTGEVPVTVVHLHGAKVAPESDGDPDAAFPPGMSSPLYVYPNPQAAATMWYHDHALGITRLNVYMGLAGFYFIRDAAENALNLPRGHNEVPLMIQDKSFNVDGSLKYHSELFENFHGEFIVVNGKVWPYLDVRRGKYRFRIANGSNSRAYTLSFVEDVDPFTFHVIGTDLGLTASPIPMQSLTILPGERYDVVFDFAQFPAGREIYLKNSAVAPFPNGSPGTEIPNVMKFNVTSTTGHTAALPAALVPVVPIPENTAHVTRTMELRNFADAHCPGHVNGTWLINGLLWHDVVDFPRENSHEIWSWVNRSPFTHPMHIHLVRFQVLDRQAFTIVNQQVVPQGPLLPPFPYEAGWKDTVQATPNQITRVIARFEGFRGLFPFHCHILEHEDHEMMRQFQVVCSADYDDGTGTGMPDGGVTIEDLLYYLTIFDLGAGQADLDDGSGTGTPDGGVTIEDLLYYLVRFDIGC